MQRIQTFWLDQTAAEYASSAITVEYVHGLQRIGASPDLILQGLRIADDEMNHASLAYQIASNAGASAMSPVDDELLCIHSRHTDLRKTLFEHNLRFYCLGETVAIPLFKAMREQVKRTSILDAFNTILQDEGRHSEFGWLNLAWMDEQWAEARDWLTELLPYCLEQIQNGYVVNSEYDPELSNEERSWGMLSKQAYGDILNETIHTIYAKRFMDYGVDLATLCQTNFSSENSKTAS